MSLVQEAAFAGARRREACSAIGLSARTIERWRKPGTSEDRRGPPRHALPNQLSAGERRQVLATLNSKEFRALSPKQVVPALADQGRYLASEATMYRILRQEQQLRRRDGTRAPTKRAGPKEHVAVAPNQVWSWDITYLKSQARGQYFFLYLIVDVFSRRIMGWDVLERESGDAAATLIHHTCAANQVDSRGLVLHSDNGGPMKGATMLATLQWLGVVPSFSRPRVSNDNPFSEALFRTLKYRPTYPERGFANIEAARAWADAFVRWYNTQHRHSGIRYVTPDQRHSGAELTILARRQRVYAAARTQHPARWTGSMRDWNPMGPVRLNPAPDFASLRVAA